MKKVTILALHLNYGGIEKCISTLANMLVTKYDVEIVCNYKLGKKPSFYIDDKVKIRYLTDKYIPTKDEWKKSVENHNPILFVKQTIHNIITVYKRKQNMKQYIKNSNSDVIISTRDIHNKWLGSYGKKDTLKIGWEHNYPNQKNIEKVSPTVKKLDYFVLLTKKIKEIYQKNTKTKCICIPNSIELNNKLSKLNTKNLISVGRLSKEKGYDSLIEVFNVLNQKDSSWTLDIIGNGDEYNAISKLIDKYNLNTKITLHGFKDSKFINQKLKESSIYLMTSHTESFPLVLLEAMNYGLPCIAFDEAEGAVSLIKNNYNGYLIKNRDINKMVKKIMELYASKDLMNHIGSNAHEYVKQYDFNAVKNKWIKLIEGRKI